MAFIGFLMRRLSISAATVVFATALTFVLIHLAPGDAADIVLRRVFIGDPESAGAAGDVAVIASRFGFDNPLVVQYTDWAIAALHLDFGLSVVTGMPVAGELLLRLGPTLILAFAATLVSLAITGLMVAGCRWLPRAGGRAADMASVVSVSIPNFYLGLMLVLVFSVGLDLLPVSGAGGWRHYILPVAVLALGQFGYLTALTRGSLNEASRQLYVDTARGKGLSERLVFRDHVLRNAIVPVVPYAALQLGFLLGGVVVVERLFSLPGLGGYLIDSLDVRDVPAFLATVGVIAAFVSLVNLAGDLLLYGLDPRIRFSARRA